MTSKDGKEVHKNIQLTFMNSCKFMVSSLNKLVCNLDDDKQENIVEFYKGEEAFKLFSF